MARHERLDHRRHVCRAVVTQRIAARCLLLRVSLMLVRQPSRRHAAIRHTVQHGEQLRVLLLHVDGHQSLELLERRAAGSLVATRRRLRHALQQHTDRLVAQPHDGEGADDWLLGCGRCSICGWWRPNSGAIRCMHTQVRLCPQLVSTYHIIHVRVLAVEEQQPIFAVVDCGLQREAQHCSCWTSAALLTASMHADFRFRGETEDFPGNQKVLRSTLARSPRHPHAINGHKNPIKQLTS